LNAWSRVHQERKGHGGGSEREQGRGAVGDCFGRYRLWAIEFKLSQTDWSRYCKFVDQNSDVGSNGVADVKADVNRAVVMREGLQ
jgi:hypothetical protein